MKRDMTKRECTKNGLNAKCIFYQAKSQPKGNIILTTIVPVPFTYMYNKNFIVVLYDSWAAEGLTFF